MPERRRRGLGYGLLCPGAGQCLGKLSGSFTASNCLRVASSGCRSNPLRAEPVLHIVALQAYKGEEECLPQASSVMCGHYMVSDCITPFKDKATEVQRGRVTYSKAHSKAELGLTPALPCSRPTPHLVRYQEPRAVQMSPCSEAGPGQLVGLIPTPWNLDGGSRWAAGSLPQFPWQQGQAGLSQG